MTPPRDRCNSYRPGTTLRCVHSAGHRTFHEDTTGQKWARNQQSCRSRHPLRPTLQCDQLMGHEGEHTHGRFYRWPHYTPTIHQHTQARGGTTHD